VGEDHGGPEGAQEEAQGQARGDVRLREIFRGRAAGERIDIRGA
jgi:hypothetical protein